MNYTSRLLLMLLMITMLILTACGETEDQDEPSPTPPAFSQASPTPPGAGPTVTPLPQIGSIIQVTAPSTQSAAPTGLVIPTSQQTIPTSIAVVPTTPPTLAINISSPTIGNVLRGSIAVQGSASHPNFRQYALEYGPDPNPSNLWYPITSVPITTPVINGILGGWNTTNVADGNYQLRLHLWLNTGAEEVRVVTGLQVRNVQVVTQPPRNNNPAIAPIGAITLTRGRSITIALGMSDPDNDPLTYVAQVANPGIATVAPAGAAAITINGIADGQTIVAITVSDQRGGTATVSFTVNVVAPPTTNNPPAIEPIASRTINLGESIDISVLASDPDQGDQITLTAATSAASIASATLDNRQLRITGNSEGSASITITARDRAGLTSTIAFLVTVQRPVPANQEPRITAIGSQTLTTGSTVDVPMSITDPNNDPLTVEATSSNNGIVSASVVNTSTLRLNGVAAGNASVTVTARDGRGGTATATFNVTVNDPPPQNRPPTISAISDVSVQAGDTTTVNVSASDPDGDQVGITAISANPGVASLTINASTITISGVAEGVADITVSASDGTETVTETFSVNVTARPNQPPTIGNINDVTIDGGQTTTIPVSVSDPDGDQLSLSATAADGSIATATIDNGNVVVTGISGGETDVTVSVTDNVDTVSETFRVTVVAEPPNQPPTVSTITDVSLAVGESTTIDVPASDPDNDSLTISVSGFDTAVANATVSNSQITVQGVGGGTTAVIVEVSDGEATANTSFNVTVDIPNQPPSIQPIGDVTVEAGQSTTANVVASDPDGDTLQFQISGFDPNIAAMTIDSSGVLAIQGVAAGTTQGIVTVSDGQETASATVNVTVSAFVPPNQPPSIQPIGDVTVEAGQSTTANVVASDPNGDTLTFQVSGFDPNIAAMTIDSSGVLAIQGVAAGTTQGTVTVSDGQETASATVNVTVSAFVPPNQPPSIQPIGDVTVDIGQSLDVPVAASDSDGAQPTFEVSGFDPSIANVVAGSAGVTVTGVSQGTTQATVTARDDDGETASTTLNITVNAPAPVNQPPVIQPIGDQPVEEGQQITVTVDAVDPDGGQPIIDAQSSEPGIVGIVGISGNQVTLGGVQPGTAAITVTASDGTDTATTSFNVTVTEAAAPPPTFDITQYDEIPTIDSGLENSIGGSNNRQMFSVAGDASVSSDAFLPAPPYDLGSYGNLQAVLDFFSADAFSQQSYAAGDGWTANTLFDPSAASPDCQGLAPLQCELAVRKPAVIFIAFTPSSATSIDINQFRQQLNTAVATSLGAGTIPVLVTLPDDGSVPADTLAAYNQVIVEVATDPSYNVPLWNLYITMQGASAGPYNVGGSGPTDLTDAALSSGVNRRNWAALHVLEALLTILQ